MIIPFFIPHAGCPFTCVYCNQYEISGSSGAVLPENIPAKTAEYIRNTNSIPNYVEIAFYGGSFTGLPRGIMTDYLREARNLKEKGVIGGIRLSTRPDYINKEILQILSEYGVTTIELGVQSLDDEVLRATCRGHTVQDVANAAQSIRQYPFSLIYQLMLGLPGDTREKAIDTAIKTVYAHPDGVRIYPTVVLRGTALAKWYEEGKYKPWSLQEAIETSADWLGLFSFYKIPVIRIGLQSSENLTTEGGLLAGPYHPAFGEMVRSRLFYLQIGELLGRIKQANIKQKNITQKNVCTVLPEPLVILCHPHDLSVVTGQKRENIQKLLRDWGFAGGFTEIVVRADSRLERSDIAVMLDDSQYVLPRQEFLEKYRI